MEVVCWKYVPMWFIAATALVACGCSGETDSAGDQTTVSPPLTAMTSSLTAANPACDEDDPDPGSPISTTVGSAGMIEVATDFIGGVFYANETILRSKANPECVVHIEVAEQAFSPAGTLTVSSDLVGQDGGPPAPFVLNPDVYTLYDAFPEVPLYDFPDRTRIQIQLSGSSVFPPIPLTNLRSPAFASIHVTRPILPADGVLTIPSTAPLKIKWDATPSGALGADRHGQRVSVRLFVLSPIRWLQLYCSWPLSTGYGVVPEVLLRELRARLGVTYPLDAVIDLYAGGFKELATATSSYVLFATEAEGTTFPRSTLAVFE